MNLAEKIAKANGEAVERLSSAQPVLIDIKQAKEIFPDMKPNEVYHAGPPVSWEKMCGPVRGAIMGAMVYEGIAKTVDDAAAMAAAGEIIFSPCHHHSSVGPMAGVVSPSMYMFVVKNETFGNLAYCTINEGLGKVLRFGAYGPDVVERLKWMEEILAPALRKAVLRSGGINIKNLTSQALLMGDECHNRNVAGTSLFLKEILPHLIETSTDMETLKKITDFISGNVHFFLNISMPACKATADTIHGLEHCTIMSAMARNGTEIGIRIAGLGDQWFTSPSGNPRGLYFAGFSEEDSNPDLGDSTISETAGIGGFAMACAPAIVKFIGGKPADAVTFTREMYDICTGRHRDFQIPYFDFAGAPVGVDIRKVVETGVTPFINTGIAHREPGIGQIGAGILRAPLEMFEEALLAFEAKYGR
ncbi:MAG: hypothetical protein CVV64_04970 [Candidatus Wallbacteria bacterium HGW-Wallbacteria-1]|jgi:hypothetical protein|uniref:DUF1116 domain-containing protein n=1 Tax=Candidatus Wallbacteria bacterium HGW-Wallbacteria-1 TaxID=2013854 RepID=A0A2N1PS12_9BACT|nr:MAG: hypothetical protein CVV64_04970 [Candidatus Wallbacteria bacterium HGW-Wallbacteria-1]